MKKLHFMFAAMLPMFMADPAGPAIGNGVVVPPDATAADLPTTTVEGVPEKHAGLVERLVAILKRDEQWVVDNIEAGVKTLESIVKGKPAPAAIDPASTQTEAPPAAE